MKNKRLFSEFPPVSTDDWIKKIEKDLKGKTFEELIRLTQEGFKIKPFYREEDLKNLSHLKIFPGSFPYLRGSKIHNNQWLLREEIQVSNIEETAQKTEELLTNGVNSLGFNFDPNLSISEKTINILLEKTDLTKTEINFSSNDPLFFSKIFKSWLLNKKIKPDLLKGSLYFDPLGFYSTHGFFKENEIKDFETIHTLFDIFKAFSNFSVLTIDATHFHESGGNTTTEMAYALSTAAEYLTFLTDQGYSVDEVTPKIRFRFSIGSDYFMEIAKLRAFRYLYAKMVHAYGLDHAAKAQTHIHAVSSRWNKTVYDPYVNMLRTTTEMMSAVLGGADSISPLPFDSIFSTPDDFSERIARNQSLILQEESHFNKVVDPAAGSYYVEELTHELINQTWQLFIETEENGGYLKSFKSGLIQKRIEKEAEIKNHEIATRKRSIIGVNQYPNLTERLEKLKDESVLFPQIHSGVHQETKPLTYYRGAMPFEQLRYQTDRYSDLHPRPKVWMFTFGNLALRRARSQFASNFFGVAGFEIVDNTGFKTIEEGVKAAQTAQPDIVVLCAADEDYEQMALDSFNALKNDFIVVLAGYPKTLVNKLKAEGLENFIHVKSNLLEELKKYQKLLGIK